MHQISKELGKRFKKIKREAATVVRHFRAKDIQAFRIEVKKLRAFLRLTGTTENSNHSIELPKKIRRFYHEVGLIRDDQLLIGCIHCEAIKVKLEELPKSYLKTLHGRISKSAKYARHLVKKEALKKEEKQLKRKVPHRLSSLRVSEFLWREVNELRDSLDSFFHSDESVHAVRKVLKDLLHLWPFIKEEVVFILPSALFCSKEDLRFITRRLGKFQDTCVSLELLIKEITDGKHDEQETAFYKTLEKKLTTERDSLRREIHGLFNKRIPSRRGLALLADGHKVEVRNKLLTP
jgi:hypothetical protein